MFYSQLLLSRKGALGVVWLAAHCHKMLKKEQVQQTNISASVDRILIDEAQTFTYRILAFLLLGVVRIYSKKVEYLLKDCLEIMNKLNGVETPRSKSRSARFLPSNYQAIALPARFELDEFDLELPENQDLGSGNLRSHKKAKISGGRQKESYTRGSSKDKMPATPASSYTTPLKDILSPHAAHMDVFASASSVSVSVSDTPNKNRLFLEEDRLEPMDLDEAEDEETHGEASHEDLSTYSQDLTTNASQEQSFEIARGIVFNADDERLEPLLLDDEENELITNGKPSGEDERNNLRSPMEVEDIGSPSLERIDQESSLGIPEKSISPSDRCCHVLEQNLKVMETPVVEIPEAAGNVTEEVSVIKTPATTERPKTSKKGKRSWIDQSSVVSNKEYASWLEDASNIVRPRNVVPRTWLGAWRARKLSGMPQSVLEPIIPFPRGESVGIIKTSRPAPVTEPPMEASANEQTSPVIIQSGEIVETSAPLYYVDDDFVSHSLEVEQEHDSVSLNSGKEDVFSARTRIIGDYLSRKFLEKKKRKSGDEALNMSQLLEGKTKKASARLFYEILVLKSHDCIDVKQDVAYHDILLRQRDS